MIDKAYQLTSLLNSDTSDDFKRFLVENKIDMELPTPDEDLFVLSEGMTCVAVGKLRYKADLSHQKAHLETYVLDNTNPIRHKRELIRWLLTEAQKKEIAQVSILCPMQDETSQKLFEKMGARLEKNIENQQLYWFDLLQQNSCRYSIKAVIIKDNALLVERCDYGRGAFSKLPGGGQQWGETIKEALVRECKEELGITVIPEGLLFIRDYIAKNHPDALASQRFHQVELMFWCHVADFSMLGKGAAPDGVNQEIDWIPLDQLGKSDFYPKALIPYLQNISPEAQTVYLGDVN